MPRIRAFAPGDLDEVYRICLLTADNGQDGTAVFTDPRLPGEVYAAPYALLKPSLALLAEDADGVCGYVVAALDSLDFDQRLERDWWPALRARYPEPPPEAAAGLSMQEQRAIQNIHRPRVTDPELAVSYPSHLHINLLPRLQGRGYGRRLIAALTASLRRQGSAGVHLHARLDNQRAAGFYRKIGFTELPSATGRLFVLTLQP